MVDIVKTVEDEEIPETNEEIEETVDEAAEAVLGMSDEDFEKQMASVQTTEAISDTETVEDTDESAAATSAETKKAEFGKNPEVKAKGKTKEKTTTSAVSDSFEFDPLGVDDATAVATYKELFAPFKANGKTIQVKTPQEALRLMQMGAGHVKYQNSIKPLLVQAKTLENNNINLEDLNFLIELHNKNPAAIKKLVRDANIDPYDIEVDEDAKAADKQFSSKNYSATEEQITLEEALADVRSHPEGVVLLTSLRNEWDAESRKVVMADPKILHVLVEQRESGIYDRISAEIDRRTILGELPDMPFIKAYHQVGIEMTNAGSFTPQKTTKTPTTEKTTTRSKVIERKAGTVPKTAANDYAVKAIAPIKAVVTAKPDLSNVMNMPDEEFNKIAGLG